MATVERSVVRIDRPEVQQGMTPQHRVRPLMPAAMRGDFAATDPFLALMEDWFPRGVFGKHPHRGIETVTYVVEGRIDFPLTLNMLPYTTKANQRRARTDQSRYMYDLASAVVHRGKLDAGHYYVYCRQGDQWFLFNDDQVTAATEAELPSGNVWRDRGRFDRAVEDYDKAIALAPGFAFAFYNRSQAHYLAGRFNEALADASKAAALNENAQALSLRGLIQEKLGARDAALADLRRAAALDPSLSQARDALQRLGETR